MTPRRTPLTGLPDEQWLEYPPDPTYLVSTAGRAYSTKARCLLTPRRKAPARNKRAQWIWTLRSPSKSRPGHMTRTSVGCANAVWRTFVGPIRAGYTIRHLDDDDTNNALTNLRPVNSITGRTEEYHRARGGKSRDRPIVERAGTRARRAMTPGLAAEIADQLTDTVALLDAIGQRWLSGRLHTVAAAYQAQAAAEQALAVALTEPDPPS